MKKAIIFIISILALFLLDLISIFTLNRPLFATKGNFSYQYLGLLYDIHNCPEHLSPQIKIKGNKFTCAKAQTNKDLEIIDTTKNIKDFACAETLEEFYQDENYTYYYNCIKSKYIIVKYEDGSEETVENALKNGTITIEDLDRYNIDYLKYSKEEVEKTFIRTYNILNIEESNNYNYLYLTLNYFQGEEIKTVKVARSLAQNIKEDKYYEFKFKKNNTNIEDNIESIFENTTLISIEETDKIGLDQIQDNI